MLTSRIEQPILQARRTAAASPTSLRGGRILFLVDEMAAITAGGTERQILQMIGICKRNGMEPHLCFFRHTRWLTPEMAGCPVTKFSIEKLASPHGLRSMAELTLWIKAHRFHILQTFFSDSNLVGPVIGRMARVPVVLGTRRNLNHSLNDVPQYGLLRLQGWTNRLVDMIIANSNAVLERIVETERVHRDRICAVYNGIDLNYMQPRPDLRQAARRALGIKEHHLLVGNVSGLRKVKGVRMFVDAAAEASRHDPRLRFLLIGDGELKSELIQVIRMYNLQKVFCLAGAAEDVRPYLAAFDIGVLCSHAEGFSNSLLEYMASGVPAIATDVGGNREALGSCGLLIPPQTQNLATAIQSMCDPRIREEFASAALERVKEFDIELANTNLAEIYARYLGKAGCGKQPHVQDIAQSGPQPMNISKT